MKFRFTIPSSLTQTFFFIDEMKLSMLIAGFGATEINIGNVSQIAKYKLNKNRTQYLGLAFTRASGA